jgi:steroid delta-isomerase-like uncharacterized protein
MSLDENKAIALRYFQEVWGQGNFTLEDQLLAPDYVDHQPAPGFPPNRLGHHQFLVHFRSAFPDVRYTMDDLIAEGDRVMDRWTVHATHLGEFLGVPPTGKAITFWGIDILRIVNGLITEIWHLEDQLSVLEQLGVIAAPFPPQ